MIISVLKMTAKGQFIPIFIRPDVEDLRHELGAAVDNIKLFTDVQTFICRLPNECRENVLMPGIYGDVIFTGGRGSYLAGLTAQQIDNLKKIFRRSCSYGKA